MPFPLRLHPLIAHPDYRGGFWTILFPSATTLVSQGSGDYGGGLFNLMSLMSQLAEDFGLSQR